MKPGVYFIGDLSLVLEGYYKDDVAVVTDGFQTTGEFVLPDGSMVAVYKFEGAKGITVQDHSHVYPVSHGLIGCVPFYDLTPELINGSGTKNIGIVHDFKKPFQTASNENQVAIGNINLDVQL
jgi:hypothetical protein